MMSARLNYYGLFPQAFEKLVELEQVIKDSPLDKMLIHLVKIRASQLNECAFCIDMHVKEAIIDGERHLKLHHIAGWKESNLFNDKERAAFLWTEALTKISADSVNNNVYESVRKHFDDKELVSLSMAITAINTWNRFAVSFKSVPGSLDKMYGLDKADL
jgi:AhpD family alkylhydroperoxidase